MLKVKINRNLMTNGVDIYLYEERSDGKYVIGLPTELLFRVVDENELPDESKPTISIRGNWGGQFLQAFAEELDSEGIKTSKDDRIAGTLDATKYHLQDLRQLLKLEDKK